VGKKGVSLSIDLIKKPGYHEVSQMVRSFGYALSAEAHRPDKTSRVMFIAAKDGTSQALREEIKLRFDWDGTPVRSEVSLGGSSGDHDIDAKEGRSRSTIEEI
jgi:hypothetical protein